MEASSATLQKRRISLPCSSNPTKTVKLNSNSGGKFSDSEEGMGFNVGKMKNSSLHFPKRGIVSKPPLKRNVPGYHLRETLQERENDLCLQKNASYPSFVGHPSFSKLGSTSSWSPVFSHIRDKGHIPAVLYGKVGSGKTNGVSILLERIGLESLVLDGSDFESPAEIANWVRSGRKKGGAGKKIAIVLDDLEGFTSSSLSSLSSVLKTKKEDSTLSPLLLICNDPKSHHLRQFLSSYPHFKIHSPSEHEMEDFLSSSFAEWVCISTGEKKRGFPLRLVKGDPHLKAGDIRKCVISLTWKCAFHSFQQEHDKFASPFDEVRSALCGKIPLSSSFERFHHILIAHNLPFFEMNCKASCSLGCGTCVERLADCLDSFCGYDSASFPNEFLSFEFPFSVSLSTSSNNRKLRHPLSFPPLIV